MLDFFLGICRHKTRNSGCKCLRTFFCESNGARKCCEPLAGSSYHCGSSSSFKAHDQIPEYIVIVISVISVVKTVITTDSTNLAIWSLSWLPSSRHLLRMDTECSYFPGGMKKPQISIHFLELRKPPKVQALNDQKLISGLQKCWPRRFLYRPNVPLFITDLSIVWKSSRYFNRILTFCNV